MPPHSPAAIPPTTRARDAFFVRVRRQAPPRADPFRQRPASPQLVQPRERRRPCLRRGQPRRTRDKAVRPKRPLIHPVRLSPLHNRTSRVFRNCRLIKAVNANPWKGPTNVDRLCLLRA